MHVDDRFFLIQIRGTEIHPTQLRPKLIRRPSIVMNKKFYQDSLR